MVAPLVMAPSLLASIACNCATMYGLLASGKHDAAERNLSVNTLLLAVMMAFMLAIPLVFAATRSQTVVTAYFFMGDIFSLCNPLLLVAFSAPVRRLMMQRSAVVVPVTTVLPMKAR